jgi:N-acetylneuraminate synthase
MTIVIAEAGVNHNGEEELAFKLVDAAFDAGADIVKFQTFKAGELASKHAVQAEYQVSNTKKKESQIDMLRRLELPFDLHHKLVSYCEQLGINFLSTAFDSASLRFLIDDLGLNRLKIPSGDITNAPFILEHARSRCDLILSTGMSNLSDIELALSVIAFGYIAESKSLPSLEAFREAYASKEGQLALMEKVTVLHCTTEYPAPFDEINLNVLQTLRASFGLSIGYSDHSEGIFVPIAAVAKGASVIEKHFTLDKTMTGPDHRASLNPEELTQMIAGIRIVELALGCSIKSPTTSEFKNIPVARKSLVARSVIKEGEEFTKENIGLKRPGNGRSPFDFWSLIGNKASRNYDADEFL